MKVDQVVRAPQSPKSRYSLPVTAPFAINPIANEPVTFAIMIPMGNWYFGRKRLSNQNLIGAPMAAPNEKSKRLIIVAQKFCAQLRRSQQRPRNLRAMFQSNKADQLAPLAELQKRMLSDPRKILEVQSVGNFCLHDLQSRPPQNQLPLPQ